MLNSKFLTVVVRLSATVAVMSFLNVSWGPLEARSQGGEEGVRFYIGTYTDTTSTGIYLAYLDRENGRLAQATLAAECLNPSFLASHPSEPVLYAVNEVSRFGAEPTGYVSAYTMDPDTGLLGLIGQAPSGGAGPCHLEVGAEGRLLAAANYGEGTVSLFGLDPSGRFSSGPDVVQHRGSGPNQRRQDKPHAHCSRFGPRGVLFAADLGVDKVLLYRPDADQVQLRPFDPHSLLVEPGSGPRHVAFHPRLEEVYVVNELLSTVSRFRPFGDNPEKPLQTVGTLPPDYSGESWTAEIAVSPDGRFLYVSNRGHDSIAIFRIGREGLVPVGHQPTGGKTPRHFSLDPSGAFMIVANQRSDNLVLFRVDREDGTLSPAGSEISVSRPVCVRFPAVTIR